MNRREASVRVINRYGSSQKRWRVPVAEEDPKILVEDGLGVEENMEPGSKAIGEDLSGL